MAADASVAPGLSPETAPLHQLRTASQSRKRAQSLDELEAQFTTVCFHAKTLVDSAGNELCCARPAPGVWSVAECLQHLNISADAYFPIWQQLIANAGPRKTEMSAPYRIDFWGRLLAWILEPPPRVRSRTPAHLEPLECKEIAPVLDGFVERQQRIIGTLRRCRGRAVDEVKMASPADPRIRYSIWSSFVINAAHQRRHLLQAEQAIKALRQGG